MKRRIAYILTTYPCRSETFIHNEISLLREKGLDIVIFAATSHALGERVPGGEVMYRPDVCSIKAFWTVFEFLIGRPIAFSRTLLCLLKYLFNDPAEGVSLMKNIPTICYFASHLKKLKVSHIHGAFLSWPGRMAHVLSKTTGLPYSLAAHARDGYVEGGALGLKVINAEFVVCCSQTMADYIQAKVNSTDRHKIHTVYHGVTAWFKMQGVYSPGSVPILAAIGRFVKKKGFECLVTAFKDILEKIGNAKLLLIGDGPESDNLKKLVQKYEIEKQVVFTGWLSHRQVLEELSRSSLLVVPSVVAPDNDRDGIPNVILEAFMLKVPVIASNLRSIQEAIVDGDNGLLYDPGNNLQLKDKIIRLLGSQSLRTQIAERAFEICGKRFNALANVEKLYSLFDAAAS